MMLFHFTVMLLMFSKTPPHLITLIYSKLFDKCARNLDRCSSRNTGCTQRASCWLARCGTVIWKCGGKWDRCSRWRESCGAGRDRWVGCRKRRQKCWIWRHSSDCRRSRCTLLSAPLLSAFGFTCRFWVKLSDTYVIRTLCSRKCFNSQLCVEFFQGLGLQIFRAIIFVLTPVCTCQPFVLTVTVTAECRPQHWRNIYPVVEEEAATGLCSNHYKAFCLFVFVNAVIIQNAFNTSLHFFPPTTVKSSSLWNSISQGKGRSFVNIIRSIRTWK